MSLDLTGRRVAILGMARSGIGAAKLVHRLGGRALVSDIKPADTLISAIEELRKEEVEIETGSHARAGSERFDLIVLSPGVVPPPDCLQAWKRNGNPIWSELQFAAEACESGWIGVTGSNGKTTTVNLIAAMMQQAEMDAVMVGNVGQAWSGFLPAPAKRIFIVEVSSFQLEFCPHLRPKVGVWLNLFENHLDRHGEMSVYAELKSRLLIHQTEADVAILNADDTWIRHWIPHFHGQIVTFGQDERSDFRTDSGHLIMRAEETEEVLLPRNQLPLVGRHNELNALAAAAAAYHVGADLDSIRQALRTARPVEHRIEFVTRRDGVDYYNDSKSTNMTATMTALDSFQRNVILLFGGRPKKESFAPLASRFGSPLKMIVALGEAVSKVRSDLPDSLPIEYVADLASALSIAKSAARSGDTILFSPGCTSFDQFKNFEERGTVFKALVNS